MFCVSGNVNDKNSQRPLGSSKVIASATNLLLMAGSRSQAQSIVAGSSCVIDTRTASIATHGTCTDSSSVVNAIRPPCESEDDVAPAAALISACTTTSPDAPGARVSSAGSAVTVMPSGVAKDAVYVRAAAPRLVMVTVRVAAHASRPGWRPNVKE